MIEVAPTPPKKMTYDEAVLYCQFLTHRGFTNWRLPTYEEWYDHSTTTLTWFEGRDIRHERLKTLTKISAKVTLTVLPVRDV
jgi:hypothetical protein